MTDRTGAAILDRLADDGILVVVQHDDPFDDLAERLGGHVKGRYGCAGTVYAFRGPITASIYADAELLHRLAVAAGRATADESTVCGSPHLALVMIAPHHPATQPQED